MVPKVWIATQARVTKGQNAGCAEAIQTWVVSVSFNLFSSSFNLFHHKLNYCTKRAYTENELSNLLPKIIRIIIFVIRCLSLGSPPDVHQTQISAAIKNVWEPLL